jgi:hypothetical protein
MYTCNLGIEESRIWVKSQNAVGLGRIDQK